jgi:hypothetical protein
MHKTLVTFDPGITTGYSRFLISNKVELIDFGVFSIDSYLYFLRHFPLGENDLVVIERFTNPFMKLTKDVVATIELVGILKYWTFLKSKKEPVLQTSSQKKGYMQFAKLWMENFRIPLGHSKRHAADAIAHGILYATKNIDAKLPQMIGGLKDERYSL